MQDPDHLDAPWSKEGSRAAVGKQFRAGRGSWRVVQGWEGARPNAGPSHVCTITGMVPGRLGSLQGGGRLFLLTLLLTV